MALLQELKDKREAILALAAKHKARNVRVFGSVIRGEETTESDVDFLVDFDPGAGLLDLGFLLEEMEQLLGRKVDIVTERGLYWMLKRKILSEARPL